MGMRFPDAAFEASLCIFNLLRLRLDMRTISAGRLMGVSKLAGFTIIEILCVIIIIATLSSTALSSFIDFRNEARAAATHQSLMTIRSAIKNQTQQAMLRCGVTNVDTWSTQPGFTFFVVLGDKIDLNDMTAYSHLDRYRICTPAQLPNETDRKFWDVSSQQEAHDKPPNGSINYDTWSSMPPNAFVTYKDDDRVYVFGSTDTATIAGFGGKCAYVDHYAAINRVYHWWYKSDTGEIFPGTRTRGFDECEW